MKVEGLKEVKENKNKQYTAETEERQLTQPERSFQENLKGNCRQFNDRQGNNYTSINLKNKKEGSPKPKSNQKHKKKRKLL